MKKRTWLQAIACAVCFVSIAAAAAAIELSRAEAPPRALPDAWRPAHELELLQIQNEGRVAVRDLSSRLGKLTDPVQRLALQRQIVELKREYRLRFLETLAASAELRGDHATADEARLQIERIENPPRPMSAPVHREAPSKRGLDEREERP
jgi:hypothetical protein